MLIHPVPRSLLNGSNARIDEQEENYKQRDLLRDIFSQINSTFKGKVWPA